MSVRAAAFSLLVCTLYRCKAPYTVSILMATQRHLTSRQPHERAGADIADSSTHAVRHTSPDIPPVRARLRAVLTQRVCPHQCQPCTHHHVVSLPPAVRLLGGSPHAPARTGTSLHQQRRVRRRRNVGLVERRAISRSGVSMSVSVRRVAADGACRLWRKLS